MPVQKKAGILLKAPRICVDYRKLNASTIPNQYPVSYIHDFTSGLQGIRIFKKIDLTKAYHQISVAPEDISKTAVTTPFGFRQNAIRFTQRCLDLSASDG